MLSKTSTLFTAAIKTAAKWYPALQQLHLYLDPGPTLSDRQERVS